MAAYYFDSSALVKYYAQEAGTNWVRALINAQPTNEIFIALLPEPRSLRRSSAVSGGI